jgi:hypothetical protein
VFSRRAGIGIPLVVGGVVVGGGVVVVVGGGVVVVVGGGVVVVGTVVVGGGVVVVVGGGVVVVVVGLQLFSRKMELPSAIVATVAIDALMKYLLLSSGFFISCTLTSQF